ncbi:MAG: V-type ATP synthase subunit E [Christensenellales bacterium]
MQAQPLFQKIEDDARQAAAQILANAREKAQAVSNAADQDIAALRQRNAQRIEQDAEELRLRMQRMDELEGRKALLAHKRTVLDEAFASALQQLQALQPTDMRAFFLDKLVATAQGGEAVLSGAQGGMDKGMVDEANQLLAKQGKPAGLVLSPDTVPGMGFALLRDGIQVVCTFDRLVSDARMGLETEIAAILFE